MSGRNNHFIPQLFLKGFEDPSAPDHLWRLTRNDKPRLVKIETQARKRDFYGKPGPNNTSELDQRITQYEYQLGKTAKSIREIGALYDVIQDDITSLFLHLISRTKHLRLAMIDLHHSMYSNIAEAVSSVDFLKKELFRQDGTLHPELERVIPLGLADLYGRGALRLSPETASRVFRWMVREKADSFLKPVAGSFDTKLDQLAAVGPDLAAEAHNNALEQDLMLSKRRNKLAGYRWEILDLSEPSVLLPDCVGLCVTADGFWAPPLLAIEQSEVTYLFPVSATRVLIGSKGRAFDFDLAEYSAQAQRHATEFVLASGLDHLEEFDRTRIGTGVPEVVAHAVTVARREVFPEAEEMVAQPLATEETPKVSSLSVFLTGGINQKESEVIGMQTAAIVSAFQQRFPLPGLGGITYSADLAEAARNFAEKHDCDPVLPTPREDETFITSSVNQRYFENGEQKSHPIVGLQFGLALLSQETIGFGVLALVGALAPLALEHFQKHHTVETKDHEHREIRARLASYTHQYGFFDPYFSARVATELGGELTLESDIEGLADYLSTAPLRVLEIIGEGPKEADDVLIPGLQCALTMGQMAARLAGMLDAAGPDLEGPTDLIEALEGWQLHEWFCLFREDLQARYSQLPRMPEPDADPLLDHLDRLLWALLLWVRPDGDGLWVDWGNPQDTH
ncbi:DUF4238 domain-containing protein [Marinicauda pacifica]|uniref:DUF4238 domain-containing protein n=1 Tax=Marinicauda pacifica TaxID=1133559 RepID=UPI0035C795DC